MYKSVINALVLSLAASAGAYAQNYPSKPVHLIVGNAAGGPTDIAARYYADKLQTLRGQPVIVENRAGASYLIASQYIAKSAPDGYNLLYGAMSNVTGPYMLKSWDVDPVKDLTPITNLVKGVFMVGVQASAPYNTIEEWIAYMKANPGKLNFANGTQTDLVSFEMVKKAAGVQWETIRYQGSTPAQAAVLGGTADFFSMSVGSNAKSLIAGGKIKFLALLTAERSKIMPNIPALGESRIPELRELAKYSGLGQYWFGLLGPAALPRPLVTQLHQDALKISSDPDYVKKVNELGVEVVADTPEEFTKMITEVRARFALEARKVGIEPQ